ncbi:YihY/virulence factor BrkB family protein [Dermatophilus congolensis]|uniref:YihY/virulence factor BrkB family protein n=1 Tax=Dermatophilus congolensis TaxID=1863 RepID=UPI002444DCA8|nr:YihY/virulence factor BrkB family protein [Dermatophilus congolensis]
MLCYPHEGVGAGAGVGLVVAFFTASMYVRAFARFVNQIYGVKEGRTLVRFWSDMYLLTAVILVLAAAVLTLLVVSGPVAEAVGTLLGLDRAGIDMYAVAKWPVLVMLVVATLSLLYRFTPNVHSRSRRFPSQGAFIALATAACASVGFGVYVSNFAQYDAMYGTLTGAVLFLLGLWILNVAMLFGAVVDFEIERTRQLNRGLPAEDELQLVPRSTVAADRADERAAARVEAGRRVRAGISADHQE